MELAVALMIVGMVAARRWSTRTALGVLGVLTVIGLPWILSSLVAGLSWMLVEYRRQTHVWVRVNARELTITGCALAVAVGLTAGLVAVPTVHRQLTHEPLQCDIVAPPSGAIPVAVVLFAAANAIGEELLWRGALLRDMRTLSTPMIIALQFVSFGVAQLCTSRRY